MAFEEKGMHNAIEIVMQNVQVLNLYLLMLYTSPYKCYCI